MKKLVFLLIVVGAGYFGYQKLVANQDTRLEPLYEPPYVLVYGTDTCGWTQRCLREIRDKQLALVFENINKPEVKAEAIQRVKEAGLDPGRLTIPIIDVNGAIFMGYLEPEKIETLYHIPVTQ